jgi:hypothetical protein
MATQLMYLSLVLSAPYGIFPAFRPDIHSLLSRSASFSTKRSHELALIRIGQYLKGTRTKGPTFKPDRCRVHLSMSMLIVIFGLYGHEDRNDPTNVKSRAGSRCYSTTALDLVITLMKDVCLSTMMAEYYALSHCTREVIPLASRPLYLNVVSTHPLRHSELPYMKILQAALLVLEPDNIHPLQVLADSKVHWFRSFFTKTMMAPTAQSLFVRLILRSS